MSKTRGPSSHIQRLERRMHHLEERINTSPNDLTWDKAEWNALRFAVEHLRGCVHREEA